MKELNYSIKINRPQEFVFNKLIDSSIYYQWAKAWGEGMSIAGEWKEGSHISFFDKKQGGTKAIIEKIIPHELIETKNIAMVNSENVEIEPSDDMMRKWIGTEENYYFIEENENETIFKVVMKADQAFEEMMNAWYKALGYFKEACEK